MVLISIQKAKKLSCSLSLYISSPYDPLIVEVMRTEPYRFWHPDSMLWELPATRLDKVKKRLNSLNKEYTIQGESLLNQTDISLPAGFKFKTTPYSFQIEGVKYGLQHDKFLLGDEQGTGKTKQSIDIACIKKITRKYKHCLVVCCVNGTKWNWQKEIGIHSDETGWILGTRTKSNGKVSIGSTKDKLADLNNLPESYFLITNIESLRDKEVATKIKQLCSDEIIGMIVVDEIHKCRNSSSQQTKGLLKIGAETQIALTGTPLMNNAIDLYSILKWLSFEKHSLYAFKNHYCVLGGYGGYEIVGYKNLNELQERLSAVMLRRLKKDVLDLPEKIYITEYVEMDKAQKSVYDEVLSTIRENTDKLKKYLNPLEALIRLRQATGYCGLVSSTVQKSAKLDRLEEMVCDVVEAGAKCLIFSNWTDMVHEIQKRLNRFNPAIITGETKDRVVEENRFMTDKNCKCIIGTIGAMGTGLTLTAGTTVFFVDEPWNRGNKEQAEDRAHRIGTNTSVNIISLITKNTIDERIHNIVYEKGKLADMLVDKTTTKEELFDILIS